MGVVSVAHRAGRLACAGGALLGLCLPVGSAAGEVPPERASVDVTAQFALVRTGLAVDSVGTRALVARRRLPGFGVAVGLWPARSMLGVELALQAPASVTIHTVGGERGPQPFPTRVLGVAGPQIRFYQGDGPRPTAVLGSFGAAAGLGMIRRSRWSRDIPDAVRVGGSVAWTLEIGHSPRVATSIGWRSTFLSEVTGLRKGSDPWHIGQLTVGVARRGRRAPVRAPDARPTMDDLGEPMAASRPRSAIRAPRAPRRSWAPRRSAR